MSEANLHLAEVLTISDAQSLYESLHGLLAQETSVVVDCAAVKRVDTAILQCLLAFNLAASRKGIACRWANVSDALAKAVNLLGLDAEMGMGG
ncbi:MAG: STAS domain-containing protein [Oleiphilaceae bacterium]|nr:STAS domain-containing protein [Oleiphilaceae bacterium]